MPFFLEYVTGQGAGRFTVESTTLSDAVARSGSALEGLDCVRAALRYTVGAGARFGEGPVLAVYSPAEGWKISLTREACTSRGPASCT
ncbi:MULTISPECIES: hypothetical protein [unclassified Arthrobacter]|uniref:hypothetical protein n=1 Tax=unclassified Arthrobacter TaxID=235627 RepID=UPI001C8461C8|nr:hypothetical protein [Arthrobacter sp. MAHUQ-56]MBX7443350.1 hypothetical protein [Arthrobacter sp. MAHUQ-56]